MLTTTYVLVAITAGTLSANPVPPTVTNLGEYDTSVSCSHAQQLMASYTPGARAIYLCLPQQVPDACVASPPVCSINDLPPVISQP